MNVWVVREFSDDDSGEVLGVFASEVGARDFAESKKPKDLWSGWYVIVEGPFDVK